MTAQHEEGCCDENASMHFLACKGLPNDDVGVDKGHGSSGGTAGDAGSKPAISSNNFYKVGGGLP